MDEMKITTSFAKAFISTLISNILRSNGIDIDISISQLELTRDDTTKKTRILIKAEGNATDEQLTKLIGG